MKPTTLGISQNMNNLSVPYLDLTSFNLRYAKRFSEALQDVLENDSLILGKSVQDFEESFARYCGSKFCIGVGSGLSALEIALKCLDVQFDDEIIVPANTYIATWLAVTNLGAKVVPVEPEIETALLHESAILQHVNERTKCVILVDLYGATSYSYELHQKLRELNIPLVIDAAQSHGASYYDQKVGSLGDITCWSFYPGKNLGALGDGGAITCNDPVVAQTASTIRNYGSNVKYTNELLGTNSRLDTIQAKFLQIKLNDLDSEVSRRNEIASMYKSYLPKDVRTLSVPDHVRSAWHIFPIFHNKRDELQKFLLSSGIGTIIHYPIPPYRQKCYSNLNFKDYPISDRLHFEELSLPCNSTLSDDDVRLISKEISKFNC